MDTQTLLRLAHSDYKIKRTFGGVFASDILPEKRVSLPVIYREYRSSSMSTDSVRHKTQSKRLTRSESESDVELGNIDRGTASFEKIESLELFRTSSPEQ
ncbi:hypothetical protein TNCV_580891 [Trichonephila clavipes]|nr:hypothetical protein TNCV_580891 [Trichonephila clavipes]